MNLNVSLWNWTAKASIVVSAVALLALRRFEHRWRLECAVESMSATITQRRGRRTYLETLKHDGNAREIREIDTMK